MYSAGSAYFDKCIQPDLRYESGYSIEFRRWFRREYVQDLQHPCSANKLRIFVSHSLLEDFKREFSETIDFFHSENLIKSE